jgi:hypothetical protein
VNQDRRIGVAAGGKWADEPWRKHVRPYSDAWQHLLDRAQSGFVHAMEALPVLSRLPNGRPCNVRPADVANLLATMVKAGELEPLDCTPCADQELWHSLCAFRGLHGGSIPAGNGGPLPAEWQPWEAHLFGYRLPETSPQVPPGKPDTIQ